MELSYIINRLGESNDEYYGAIAPPLIQTSNFCYKSCNDLQEAISDEKNNLIYSRGNNPTLSILSEKIAALEGADDALLFASGMAAISCAVISSVKQGDHVICVQHAYSWTNALLRDILSRFGVNTDFVDGKDLEKIKNLAKPETTLIYIESPNSLTLEMQDIAAIASFAREKGIFTIADNSYATPLYQQPLKLGVDIVVHSATKYLSGHSDTVAGVLCSSKKIIDRIFMNEYLTFGGICSPFNAWLMLRGLRTLPLRMERISASTQKVVSYLRSHSAVDRVVWPFDEDNPQLDIAKKQMKNASGLFSVYIKTLDTTKIARFVEGLGYFHIAVSWGGYESLVFPGFVHATHGNPSDVPLNLIRFSIGLEDAEVLIADLKSSLEKMEI
jgi:cystathionine beta-lyase